ncbi:MAG: Plug domain-containing protein [Gemmatimonadetes bacterium]|nr:Plug domain-containing protein [Gemmatimonadota bacterium]
MRSKRLLAPLLALMAVWAGESIAAQDPPDSVVVESDSADATPDSIALPADSVVSAADSLEVGGGDPGVEAPDTLAVDAPDTLAADAPGAGGGGVIAAGDTLPAPAGDSVAHDTVPRPPVFPSLPDPTPDDPIAGVWEWDRRELLGARGQTLWELLAEIPGLIAVRSGDFGHATAVFPVGYAGGGLRLYYDGVEHLPLEGSLPDLARIPLSGLESVRVVQRPGGVEVRLRRLVHSDGRPSSLIEAGTGDLDTNLLRATFSLPSLLGGKGALALDRLDTQGRDDPGSMTGFWFRYSVHSGDRAGLRYELRRMATDRVAFEDSPTEATRSDWTLHGRLAVADGLLAEGWATRASVAVDDTTESFPFSVEARGQRGVRLTGARGPLWARIAARFNEGEGVADNELGAELAARAGVWGGVSAKTWRESWDERTGTGYAVRGWATPHPFAALFVEHGQGARSVPFLVPLPPEEPDTVEVGDTVEVDDTVEVAEERTNRFTDRTGTRLGARARWRGYEATVSRLWIEADSVWPTELLFDRGGLMLPQLPRRGWEVAWRLPVWPKGMALTGEVHFWEDTDTMEAPPPYFPDYIYRASLSLHRTYLESGNFELWVDLGVHGRPPMSIPIPEDTLLLEDDEDPVPQSVPFYQNWYFRLQMRIHTLIIFATVENFTLRENNQDLPGVLLPINRGMYGVRWSFWN